MTLSENLRTVLRIPLSRKLSLVSLVRDLFVYPDLKFIYYLSAVKFVERTLRRVNVRTQLTSYSTNVYADFVKLRDLAKSTEDSGYNLGAHFAPLYLILYATVREFKPRLVIETGVASGFSSYFILKALEDNQYGSLISIDLPNYSNQSGYVNYSGVLERVYTPPSHGIGWVVPNKLRNRWKLIIGNSVEELSALGVQADIFLHDSDHSYEVMSYEFNWAYENGARLILSDDIGRNKAWLQFVSSKGLIHAEFDDQGIAFRNVL